MKTPNPTKAELSAPVAGALIIAAGPLPVRLKTVTSEVLARLLSGERMTGLDAVYGASTTRLSAVVFSLAKRYGWTIERHDKAAGCRDGRVAWISEYWIDLDTAARARAAGADTWCQQVREARRTLRTKAALAQRLAARANEATRRNIPRLPGQWGVFEGDTQHACY